MKKIINWTFGSIFRTLGRIICYVIVAMVIGYFIQKNDIKITSLLGIERISAATITTTDNNFRIRTMYNKLASDPSWVSGSHNFGSSYSLPSGDNAKGLLDAIMVRMTNNSYFQRDTRYRLSINVQGSVKLNKAPLREVICSGISSSSNWSPNQDLISVCQIAGIVTYDNGNKTSYYVDFEPFSNIQGIQIQIYFQEGNGYIGQLVGGTINVLTSTNIFTDTATNDAINNQTTTIINQTNEINDSINDINDTINDDDVTGATSQASNFFNNFTTNNHGLTGIITAPLNAIQSLTNSTCSPLVLPLPYVNQNLTLPCMRDIYVSNFGSFMNIYDIITLGIVSYWIMVRLFSFVKDFKNPDHDEIEVVDL